MTVDEFIARTGCSLNYCDKYWSEIIREYNSTDEHKNEFCRRWVRERAIESHFDKQKKALYLN